MGEIHDINENKPHISGPAVCLNCKHEWQASALAGTLAFECPECHLFKGVSQGLIIPDCVWECICGCSHFFLHQDAPICAHCGIQHDYEEVQE